MVIYLAGLQSIPEEMYDAAMVDGANSWQRLLYITIPLLRPTTFFLFVTGDHRHLPDLHRSLYHDERWTA